MDNAKRGAMCTFRLDTESAEALRELELAAGTGMHVKRRRSTAIRRALIEASLRLKAESKL